MAIVQKLRYKSALLLSAGCLLALAGYLVVAPPWRRIDDRVYRIGWQQVPPFQQKAADGSPTGLAVEFVRNAARNRGIRLEWVFHPGSSEAALRNHEVDLWVLMTVLPERQGIVHISRPYMQHNISLLVRSDSTYHSVHDLEAAAIGHLNLPINQFLLHRILPQASLVARETEKDAIDDLCAKRTAAAFVDELTGIAALLAGPSCASQPLRVIPLPTMTITLGVGATLENAEVADEIRRGMDALSQHGDLAGTLSSWGYFSSRSTDYISALRNAKTREQWLIGTVALFAGLLMLTGLSVIRIRRQKNQIEQAEGALRRSEQKLRLMANNLREMVLAYDMNRSLVFANPAVERLTGYSVEALEKETCLMLDSSGRPSPHAGILGPACSREAPTARRNTGWSPQTAGRSGLQRPGGRSTTRQGDRSVFKEASARSLRASSPPRPCATPNAGSANFWRASSCSP